MMFKTFIFCFFFLCNWTFYQLLEYGTSCTSLIQESSLKSYKIRKELSVSMIFKEFSSISNCESFFFFFGEGGQLGISTQISPTLKWYLWPQRYQIRITQHVLKLTVNIAKNNHLFFQWSVLGSLLLDAVTTNVSSCGFSHVSW